MRPQAVALLVVALAVIASRAAADPPASAPAARTTERRAFVPTIGLGFGSFDERLRLRVGDESYDESRTDMRLSLVLGLAHPVWRFDARTWLDGHASVGLGVTLDGGHWQLPLREDVTVAWDATPWLTLRGGLGLGAVIDTTRTARSYGELGLVVSLTFANFVEVVYRPFLSLPFGSEDSPVFGGSRSLSTSVAVIPLDVALRFRLPWLTFGR